MALLVKNHACQRKRDIRDGGSIRVRKIPWRRAWQPTPILLPGESHGQKSLLGYGHGVTKSQTYWSNLARIHTSSISTLFSWFRRSTLLSATPGRHKIFQQKRRVASSCMFSCEQENLSQKPCSSLPSLHISLATVGHTPITKPFPEKVTDVDGYELAAVQGLLSEHMAT